MNPIEKSAKAYRWGLAQCEIVAVQEVIYDRLNQGFAIRHIWSDLRAEGKITTCENRFYKNLRKLREIWSETGEFTSIWKFRQWPRK